MFKKKFILFVVLIFISQPSFAENKIAFIDIELLLSKSIPSKNMLDQLKKFEDNKLVEFEKKEKVLKDNENKIISTKNLISKEEYNKKVKIFKNQIKDYQNSKNDIIQNLKKKRNKEILNFLEIINPIIQDVMKNKSIDVLIEKKNVYIVKSNYDITNDVLNNININIKEYKIKTND